jgi:glutathione peroxidase-family protein
MNDLVEKYGDKGFAAIGFPCNQFGHQTNEGGCGAQRMKRN